MGDKSPKSINKKAKQKQAKVEHVRKQKQEPSASIGSALASHKRK